MRYFSILAVLTFLFVLAPTSSTSAADRPNILWLVAEDAAGVPQANDVPLEQIEALGKPKAQPKKKV